jgi:hypothetical protein
MRDTILGAQLRLKKHGFPLNAIARAVSDDLHLDVSLKAATGR